MIDSFALQFHELKTYNHAFKYFSEPESFKSLYQGLVFSTYEMTNHLQNKTKDCALVQNATLVIKIHLG